jgi:hypothetical protein
VHANMWVFPENEAKGKTQPRVIHLTDRALPITQRLVMKHPTGKLLRNEDGVAWRRHAVSYRFLRLKKKTGEKLCLTNFRHRFCSQNMGIGTSLLIRCAARKYTHAGVGWPRINLAGGEL